MMTPQFVEANDLRFACLSDTNLAETLAQKAAGAQISKPDGPLVLCIHGFPDTPHTYTDLMMRLSEQGYRVVAPYTRGYAPTSIPQNNSFTMEDFGRDVLGLIDALGKDKAYLIGHDWGATAVYAASAIAPEKVIKAVTAAVPHPQAFKFSVAQLRKSWYMLLFQFSNFSEGRVKKNDYALIDRLWQSWSPALSAEDAQPYIQAIKKVLAEDEHLTAALNYYRALFKPRNMQRNAQILERPIGVPTLTMAGEQDGCIGAEHFSRMQPFFSDKLEVQILSGAGHFMHLEQPDVFASHVTNFFRQD